jgi:putative endonuclease
MATYSVYILYSESSDIYYIGQTDDVEGRLSEHNSDGNNSFTSKHGPWRLVSSFETGNERGVAMKIEKFIKRQKSRKFIEKVIEDPMAIRYIAQLVRVPRPRD